MQPRVAMSTPSHKRHRRIDSTSHHMMRPSRSHNHMYISHTKKLLYKYPIPSKLHSICLGYQSARKNNKPLTALHAHLESARHATVTHRQATHHSYGRGQPCTLISMIASPETEISLFLISSSRMASTANDDTAASWQLVQRHVKAEPVFAYA